MTYIFDVSEEFNDLMDVNHFVLHKGHGDYHKNNRVDSRGFMIYSVEFFDKRYALQFKLTYNATLILWDESDDQEIVTIEDLLARGYQPMKLSIPMERSQEFTEWCEARDFPVVNELKFVSDTEPFTIYAPEDQLVLVKLTWG